GEPMLGYQSIVNGNHRMLRESRQVAAERVAFVEPAFHVSATVEVDETWIRPLRVGSVQTGPNRHVAVRTHKWLHPVDIERRTSHGRRSQRPEGLANVVDWQLRLGCNRMSEMTLDETLQGRVHGHEAAVLVRSSACAREISSTARPQATRRSWRDGSTRPV